MNGSVRIHAASIVASLYLLECTGLAVTATALATGLWYLALLAVAPWLLDTFGLAINLRPLTGVESLLLLSVPLSGLVVGSIPAFQAWRLGNRPSGWGAE